MTFKLINSHDRIFGTIFRQSRTVLRFGFGPNVFGFCGVFGITIFDDEP